MAETRRTDGKIPISQTRAAIFSRYVLYFFSAGLMGKSLADLSAGEVVESIGNIGMALILAGMSFRSREFAVLAYFTDPQKRENALIKLRNMEKEERPWVGWIVRAGWIFLAFGVGCELSTFF